MRKAAFLDRDGVLNEDVGYVGSIERFRWIAGAITAVSRLRDEDFLVFVVTNQSGVARGHFDEAAVRGLHDAMQAQLRAAGTSIDAFRFCPHHPDAIAPRYRLRCECRKPSPGLILSLIDEFRIDRSRSFLVGDRASDISAARTAGIEGHKFLGGSLLDFVNKVLAGTGRQRH